jgi:hypothetical protein
MMVDRLRGAVAALLLVTGSGVACAQAMSVDALARDVDRLESLRAVKNVQRTYAHHAQFGRWGAMAALFAPDGQFVWGSETAKGRAAIAAWLMKRNGGGKPGLAPGALNAEFIDEPLVNLSADGRTAKGRWMGLAFRGDGKGGTRIEGGVYENDYVRVGGTWKIVASHYHPQYEGDYAHGWTNVGQQDLPIVPFHFTVDETGVPIPAASGPAPRSGATLGELSVRIAALNDEDAVRNLQHAYGYYVDRKMWTDIVDLFAANGTVQIGSAGVARGRDGIRRALERMGPEGLSHGQLNDRPQFDTIVEILPGGREAISRGIELGMLGEADREQGWWEVNLFRNRFVKEGGVWKLKDLHVTPLMRADYAKGWGDGGTAAPPAFLAAASTGAARPAKASPAFSPAEARRRLARSLAYEGAENVSAAYGYYIDDFQWLEMAGIMAEKGNKQSPFAGYYLGRERIKGAVTATWGPTAPTRAGISYHWRTQPVILVSEDGRSANLRTRLFQPRTAKQVNAVGLYGAVFSSGMYPNEQAVLENGIWRLWSVTIDEPYFTMKNWKDGWARVKDPAPGAKPPAPSVLLTKYPPDIAISALGKREEGFRGGTGTTIDWPGILPMWFNYRNPVSGRTPPNYLPDCVPCAALPDARMTAHGYQMPPTGPE